MGPNLLSSLLETCGVDRKEEREREGGRDRERAGEEEEEEELCVRAALHWCVTQSGGLQPAALGALTLAKSTLFFNLRDKQVLNLNVNWAANKGFTDIN